MEQSTAPDATAIVNEYSWLAESIAARYARSYPRMRDDFDSAAHFGLYQAAVKCDCMETFERFAARVIDCRCRDEARKGLRYARRFVQATPPEPVAIPEPPPVEVAEAVARIFAVFPADEADELRRDVEDREWASAIDRRRADRRRERALARLRIAAGRLGVVA